MKRLPVHTLDDMPVSSEKAKEASAASACCAAPAPRRKPIAIAVNGASGCC